MSEAPREIVVWDLDSTLADTRPRRHLCPTVDPERTWTDYAMACADDAPMPAAVRLNQMLYDAGYAQHILTWRHNDARALTQSWLYRHGVLYDRLLMQMAGDIDSAEFKLAYLHRLIGTGQPPTLVIEDWPACAAAITKATGLPVLCVNPCYDQAP